MKNQLLQLCILCFASISIDSQANANQQNALCPQKFMEVSVHNNATLCQIFDASSSSSSQSMSYYAPLAPQQIVSFYQTQHPQLSVHSQVNQRTLLTMRDQKTRIVISQDIEGAQVDILVL